MGVYLNTHTGLRCELPDDSIEAYPEGLFEYVGETGDEARAREIAEARANKVEIDDSEPERPTVVETGTITLPPVDENVDSDSDSEDGGY